MNKKTQNLVTRAIEIVGISNLTKACGLASRNAIKTWEKSGRIPIDAETDYPGIIERETSGQITRVDIWREQIDSLKPGVVYRVPVSLLNRDIHQPRRVFDTYRLQDLALSLGKDGQETPIKFIVIDGELVIKHGERRWRAAHIGKIETLDGVLDIQDGETNQERIFRQIADNTGEPLKPWDWVETFQQFHEDGLSDQNIADELASRGIKGFSRSAIANYRRLLNLPVEIQEMVKSEFLTPSHGKEILLHAKHKVIKDKLVKSLTDMKDEGDYAPPSGFLCVAVRDLYEQKFPHVDGNFNDELEDDRFPNMCPFDYDNECRDCKSTHTSKLGNGHEETFCMNPACYLEKCETAEIEQELEDSEEITTSGHHSTSEDDLDTQSAAQTISSSNQESIRQTANHIIDKQHQQKVYKKQISEAIKSANIEEVDSILVYSSLEKLDGKELTIQAISRRMQIDTISVKRIAAANALDYLLDNDVKAIGEYLGVKFKDEHHASDENLQLRFSNHGNKHH
ncbi:MAG: ParB N-terminal domain-containing protein [Candidatus Thiodiazotropha sp.]